jgi:hypothetical protein
MEKIKHLFTYTLMVAIALVMVTLSSCDDENNPTFADPTIAVTPSTVSDLPGATVSLSIAATADAGLASIAVNGTNIQNFTTEKTAAITYDYTIASDAVAGSTIPLQFVVTDKQSTAKTSSTTVNVTVGDPGKPTVTVQGAIAANTTWTNNKYYLLKGNVYVQSPAELTIEAGTIIYGDKVSKGALIINRGAKIHAVGTAAAPIVFTSSAPINYRNYGDWGGVVLLGKAVNNQNVNQTIEGVSGATGDDGKYGGTDDADNSGELQYARIEFAGIALSTDNELNGLTMGSVGSATKIDHVQVSYSGDDSYEWFGGKVNAQYLIAYKGWDDDFDTDFGYTGNVQYAVSHRDANNGDKSGSNGFESDNDGAGSTAALKSPLTAPKFSNVTWFGPGTYARLATPGTATAALNKSNYNANYQFGGHLRRNSAIQVYNSIFIGSYLEGVHFDKTNPAAVFKGNYFGRTGINVGKAVKKATTGNADGDIDLTNFEADNYFAADQATVDLTAVITGLNNANVNVDEKRLSLLATGSTLLTGAKTVPAGLTQKDYIGAFDATTDWTTETWVNFNPNGTQY